jgi:ABC-type uncharacterized transport system permease subunit
MENQAGLKWKAYLSRSLISFGIAFVLALAFISGLAGLLGYDVIKVLKTVTTTSFVSAFGFEETVKKTIPLIFATYAFTIPFICHLFNIGGLGQMLFGGTMATVVGLSLAGAGLPSYLMVPILLVVGIVSGGFLAGVAGFLKTEHNVDPIVSTIMLNFVAMLFLAFIATTAPFRDPREGSAITYPLPESATLGDFWGIPHSVIVAILAIGFVIVLLRRTRLGYEIKAIGHNVCAAQIYGISFRRTVIISFIIGGALAGLGGCLEVINIHGRLIEGFATTSGAEYGMFGILTGLVVTGSPAMVPIAGFLISVLLVGADALQRAMQVPVELVFVSQAVIVLSIVVARKILSRA